MIKYTVRSNKDYTSGQQVSVESQCDYSNLDNDNDIKVKLKRVIKAHLGIIKSFDAEEKKKEVQTFYNPIVSFDNIDERDDSSGSGTGSL